MQMCCAGTGADFVAIDEETKKQTRDPLSVKVKPKRGKSSRKQKQRLAIKLDKVLLHPHITPAVVSPIHSVLCRRLKLGSSCVAIVPEHFKDMAKEACLCILWGHAKQERG